MSRSDADADDELRGLKSALRAEREALEDGALDGDAVYGELDAAEREALTRGVLDRVVPARPRRLWPLPSYAVGGLAAAALALLAFWPRADVLPAYTLVPPASDALVRDEAQARAGTYTLGSELELLFRPATSSRVEPDLSCYVGKGETFVRFSPEVERSAEGALVARMRSGPGGNLPVGAGEHEVICLVFRRGSHQPEKTLPDATPGVQLFQLTLTLVD
jgi:hypothetical protein